MAGRRHSRPLDPLDPDADKIRRKQSARKRAVKKRKAVALAVEIAAAQGVDLNVNTNVSTLDALQFVLDRSFQLLKWAVAETDKVPKEQFWLKSVDAQGNIVTKHHWTYEIERALREEVMEIAGRMEGLDIASRRTALAEAQAGLIQRYMKAVLDQVNLTPEQQKLLGPALRSALPLIEGTSHEILSQPFPDASAA